MRPADNAPRLGADFYVGTGVALFALLRPHRHLLTILVLLGIHGLVLAEHGVNPVLANDASPYLQLHAGDPVHWRRWDSAAVDEARSSGRLLFISVGYFSCHWCHVMRRESFSDPGIARMLNSAFIPVKIDRELEPALDEHLNSFVQATRGYSGWPLNVFLTPEGYPLVGGVYLPQEQFQTLLTRVTQAWQQDRETLEKAAADAAGSLFSNDKEPVALTLDRDHVEPILANFVKQSHDIADELGGGFGFTSKFPSVPQLRTLLLAESLTPDPKLRGFLVRTLQQMADKGLRDHIGGGFFRYTTDPKWLTPHLENMLYDNALLADLYLQAADILQTPAFVQVAYDTLDFMLAEMWRDGAFAASLSSVDDKDVEGGYYLWDDATLERVLDDDERRAARLAWQLAGTPPFEQGYLPIAGTDRGMIAAQLTIDSEQLDGLLASAGDKLRAERRARTLPKDTKQLTAWNGIALGALARAAATPGGTRYLAAARQLRDVIATELWTGSTLLRARGIGGDRGQGSLQDYAYATEGLIALARTTRSAADYALLREILIDAWQRFHTERGWRSTSDPLIPMLPPSPAMSDGPTPSPSATILAVTLETAALLKDDRLREQAETAMGRSGPVLSEQPFFYASHVAVLARFVANPP
jgi:uncharacterized protein YyaL (SSP411 family)